MNKSIIAAAIARENRYLADPLASRAKQSFLSQLNELGYASIEQYRKDKQEYLLHKFKFKKLDVSLDSINDTILKITSVPGNYFTFIDIDQLLVLAASDTQYDYEKLRGLSAKVLINQIFNSCIVLDKNDLIFAISVPVNTLINRDYVLSKLVEILKVKDVTDIKISGNDILINGLKVIGSIEFATETQIIIGLFISCSDKYKLISDICLKRSTKIPGFTTLNSETIKEIISEWLTY